MSCSCGNNRVMDERFEHNRCERMENIRDIREDRCDRDDRHRHSSFPCCLFPFLGCGCRNRNRY